MLSFARLALPHRSPLFLPLFLCALLLAAIMEISKKEGVGSLFKGCMLNWVKLAPSAGLSFYFYEARYSERNH